MRNFKKPIAQIYYDGRIADMKAAITMSELRALHMEALGFVTACHYHDGLLVAVEHVEAHLLAHVHDCVKSFEP